MDNASENRVVHACWCKGRMFLWIICLIAQHCFLSGHSSMDIAIETPGSGHETHSDEGKKDNSAIGRALLVTRPPTCPSPSPSFRIRCPSTSPAQTLLRASSGPCYGPDPSHYFLFAWSPSHWLWPCICPPRRVSELPFSPLFLLLVDWVWGQPLLYSLLFPGFFQHVSEQKSLKTDFSFKESFLKYCLSTYQGKFIGFRK